MIRSLLFFSSLIGSVVLMGQQVTFFTHNRNDFGGERIFHSFAHELSSGGYVQGYDVDYKTHHEVAWEYFDETGQFTGKIQPQIRYWDVRVANSKALTDKKIFIYGNDVNAANRGLFSMCFDSTGSLLWEHNDSVVVEVLLEESDTNYIGLLTVEMNTDQFKKGYHLARLNNSGRIYWSMPFDHLLQQVPIDSGIVTPLISEMQYFNNMFIFHLMELTSFEHNQIVVFDKDFIFKGEKYAKYINSIFPHKAGVIFDYNLGKPSTFSRFAIKSVDWAGNEIWEVKANDSAVSSLSGLGFYSVGSGFCNHHLYSDSSYNFLDSYVGFYNYGGKKVRECRYEYKDNFDVAIMSSTNDKGLLMYAGPKSWDRRRIGMMKTDSLGLVYNTDIICDCKDFKIEDTTGTQQYLLPELHAQVFPNPATDKINVLLSHQQKASITLRNLNGQIVHTQQAKFNSNIIDLSALEAGVYIVEVQSSSGSELLKFVKH